MFTIKIAYSTFLKEFPTESTNLLPDQKWVLTAGNLQVDRVNTWGNHLRVELNSNPKPFYIFAGHAESTEKVLPYFNPDAKLTSIVKACQSLGINSQAQQAYVLATVAHETANTFMPIKEFRGEDQAIKLKYDGGVNYYGRGFVQLTHKYNYEKLGKLLGIDLVQNPNLALEPSIALFILCYGMREGLFTGKKLKDYINSTKQDFVSARRIINGTDRAKDIAMVANYYLNEVKTDFADIKSNLKKANPNLNRDSYLGLNPSKITLISQRTNLADRNNDGVSDSLQTCNIHAVAMVIEGLTGKRISIAKLDTQVLPMPGSRYSHNNLVSLLDTYSVTSKFSTSHSFEQLIAHLRLGYPAIWSNKLTHSGHIVVIAGYRESTSEFLIFDSYGQKQGNKYIDVRKPYWFSKKNFQESGMNGTKASGHWLHFCTPK